MRLPSKAQLARLARKGWEALRATVAGLIAGALSAVTWLLLTSLGGVGLLVVGVYRLAGEGWALVTAGACCLVAAALIRKGLSRA